jgi:hypothetical protein
VKQANLMKSLERSIKICSNSESCHVDSLSHDVENASRKKFIARIHASSVETPAITMQSMSTTIEYIRRPGLRLEETRTAEKGSIGPEEVMRCAADHSSPKHHAECCRRVPPIHQIHHRRQLISLLESFNQPNRFHELGRGWNLFGSMADNFHGTTIESILLVLLRALQCEYQLELH